jgi:5-methylcytosine-specific restriction endonuclease McrA
MDKRLRELVRKRAGDLCEYCRIPQAATPLIPFHIEHIVPRQHGGSNDLNQLALACDRCNAYKGPNLSAIDPETDAVVPLFNPRQDAWDNHFSLQAGFVSGSTAQGRATVRLLNMNAPRRIQLREAWQRSR